VDFFKGFWRTNKFPNKHGTSNGYFYEGWVLSHDNYFFLSHLNDVTTKQECAPGRMALVVCGG